MSLPGPFNQAGDNEYEAKSSLNETQKNSFMNTPTSLPISSGQESSDFRVEAASFDDVSPLRSTV